MRHVTASTSVVRSGMKRLAPDHLRELAARLFMFRADRWRRRALFYRRYRDYFPRLSAGRFVDRCWELETMCRGLAEVMRAKPAQDRMGAGLKDRREEKVRLEYRAASSSRIDLNTVSSTG